MTNQENVMLDENAKKALLTIFDIKEDDLLMTQINANTVLVKQINDFFS